MLVRTQLRVNNKEFVNHVVQTSCVRPAQNAIIMVTVVEYRMLFYMIIIIDFDSNKIQSHNNSMQTVYINYNQYNHMVLNVGNFFIVLEAYTQIKTTTTTIIIIIIIIIIIMTITLK